MHQVIEKQERCYSLSNKKTPIAQIIEKKYFLIKMNDANLIPLKNKKGFSK